MKRLNELADRAVGQLVAAYFTKTSLLAHVIVYPVLMVAEGKPWSTFLTGISIEAVFIGLMVGVSTKQVRADHRSLKALIHRHHTEKP